MRQKNLFVSAALATATIAGLSIATPAAAQNGYYGGYSQPVTYNYGSDHYRHDDRDYRDQRRRDRRYNRRHRNNKRYRCDSGAGGAVIGAIAGGLLGNEVARRGDKTVGTILGGVLGGVAGRAIDRSGDRDGCPRNRRYRR